MEAAKHFDPREDVLLLPGTPLDTLDFTSYTMNLGSKLILDFTSRRGPMPAPRSAQARPKAKAKAAPGRFNPSVLKRVLGAKYVDHISLQECLLVVKVSSKGQGAAEELARLLKAGGMGRHKWLALVSEDINLDDPVSLVWGLFTRFDAARDIQFTRVKMHQAWPSYEGVLGMDATWKTGYPDPVEMPSRIVRKVDQRWRDYGFR